jgi:hypothetical protein
MARNPNEKVLPIIRRLGIKSRLIESKSLTIQGTRLSASRVYVEGADWLHLQGTTAVKLDQPLKMNRLTGALFQRLPALAVVKGTQIDYVRMPGWAFAALLQMAVTCNPKVVETVLTDYLPLGPQIPPMDLEIGYSVLSTLEEDARSSSSESSTN